MNLGIKFEKKDILKVALLIVAAILGALNLNSFVNAGGLFPGGLSGLTLLIVRTFKEYMNIDLHYSYMHLILSIIPIYIGWKYIGHKFTLFSCIYIVFSSIFTEIIPAFPVTEDILLICVFGGIFSAFIGTICLWQEACAGGTDFIAMYYTEKRRKDGWQIIFYVNLIILAIAGLLFGWDKALYSIIFQYTSKQANKVFFKKYQRETLFIVTNKPTEICDKIRELTNHAATIIEGKGSFEGDSRQMVYSVVSADECERCIREIKALDEKAFINEVHTNAMSGNFYQKKLE